MKKFKLTFQVNRTPNTWEPASVDVIESNNLLEILAQFPIVIRKVSEQELEYIQRHMVNPDDDIPF